MQDSLHRTDEQKNQLIQLKKQAHVAISCSCLVGVTWLFGVFAIGDLRLAFQVLFCVFNSLQGFLIFMLHAVNNDVARKEWKRVIGGMGSRMVSDIQKSEKLSLKISFYLRIYISKM